ncbi:hypothetical protein FIV42_01980 [Persicimonas caeni]|uniref:MYXO-CTERM sorting domain-containing protein n=1 Tax=Persicimonas caeni TaxID=2292766 RepID=A0A4Y6PML7_PERCE|nr:MYXO-CTERM sorting domain-containing protein [Persicimonas caeni]QDG49548.1 hypothetical protein FIV42_01980 [Persicimonas caeni]QED30769.1 hypothetical protein FRD00_01975 [Persicimonas caeni]
MKRTETSGLLAVAALVVALGVPALASAETECSTDADCGEGFVCETYEAPCAGACAPGEDCDTSCESTTGSECVPAPPESCTSAADCDPDLVCVTVTYETCSGGDWATCEEGTDCDAGTQADASCTTETEGYCVPPYLAPCQVNADCGPGFTCEESEVCGCSTGGSTGSGGSSDGDGSAYVDAGSSTDDENCSCSGTGEFYCELIEQECTSDSECSGDMVCDTLPGEDYDDGGTVETCTSTPDGGMNCETSSPDAGTSSESTKYCLPPDIERWIGAGGAVGSDDGYSQDGSSDEEREAVSSSVDRGGAGSSDGGSSESAGCSSTGDSGPVGALAALMLGFLGLVGLRRRD